MNPHFINPIENNKKETSMTQPVPKSEHTALLMRFKQSLILQIGLGLILGIGLGIISPEFAKNFEILGNFFINALKSVAPVLVFVLVLSAIANRQAGVNTNIKSILVLYMLGTFFAALTAVVLHMLSPITLILNTTQDISNAPTNVATVLQDLLFKMVDNPIRSILNGNYVGILAWAIGLGICFKHAQQSSKDFIQDISNGVTQIVKWVIKFAPFGIFGLVSATVATEGIAGMSTYLYLVRNLLAAMLIVALIINPLIVFIKIKKNPYPLTLQCLRDSGVTAFFTRSSAANIPVNMELCKRLNLDESTYAVSIPLGATINMAGAAITITTMTLAAVHTLNIPVSFGSMLLLSLVASLCACGASGVAGGSLLLIPLACGLFNIPTEVAMQVVGAAFIIGVIQDSAETALNSSTDVLFTAACDAEFSAKKDILVMTES